jgi:hypothetical protein
VATGQDWVREPPTSLGTARLPVWPLSTRCPTQAGCTHLFPASHCHLQIPQATTHIHFCQLTLISQKTNTTSL